MPAAALAAARRLGRGQGGEGRRDAEQARGAEPRALREHERPARRDHREARREVRGVFRARLMCRMCRMGKGEQRERGAKRKEKRGRDARRSMDGACARGRLHYSFTSSSRGHDCVGVFVHRSVSNLRVSRKCKPASIFERARCTLGAHSIVRRFKRARRAKEHRPQYSRALLRCARPREAPP